MKTKPKTLSDLHVGCRLLYRAKDDWRTAVISKIAEEKATLIVCSPTGRTYRLRRDLDSKIDLDGKFLVLKIKSKEDWRKNFSNYDSRW